MTERERIELLMKCYNLSSSQFADRTGIQRASVSHILSGRNKPSLEVMLKIYDAFPNLDMKWLMTGAGMAPVAETPVLNEVNDAPTGLFGAIENDPIVQAPSLLPIVNDFMPKKSRMQTETPRKNDIHSPQFEKRRSSQPRQVAQQPVVQRKIKEIRIFYTDGTYETLVPEK